MLKENNSLYSRNSFSVFFLLLFLILSIYSNTFQSSWHFDDKPNTVNNSRVHFKNFNCKSNRLYPNDALILLCLAEISLKKGKDVAAGEYLETLLSVFGGKRVQENFEKQSKGSFAVPISYDS